MHFRINFVMKKATWNDADDWAFFAVFVRGEFVSAPLCGSTGAECLNLRFSSYFFLLFESDYMIRVITAYLLYKTDLIISWKFEWVIYYFYVWIFFMYYFLNILLH